MKRTITFITLFLSLSFTEAFAQKGNLAKPEKHPYADPTAGRDHYTLAKEKVNEARLYDFYQRQADYYMSSASEMPSILPAYPGLDAGKHGHWGKHNQNNHKDTRWNNAEMGEVLTQVVRYGKEMAVLKGICVRLGENRQLSTCFDPQSLSYRSIWSDGFVKFDGFRWGTSRNAAIDGKPWFTTQSAAMPKDGKYLGFYRYGKRAVFHYQIGATKFLDEPWAVGNQFYRSIGILDPVKELSITLSPNVSAKVIEKIGIGSAEISGDRLLLKNVERGTRIIIGESFDKTKFDNAPQALAHLKSERKWTRRWPTQIKQPGELGKPKTGSAYAVDTLHVPYDNPWNVVMQISGIDFLPNGDALVCTLLGDIWKVSGIDQGLKKITWQRFATGLNQPIGIHIDDDGIFVLDRGQIYRLHDLNADGEVDYYENYANDFGGYDRSHTHTFGLHRTRDGSFHFTQRESILRTGPDRKTVLQGWGVRNCMGIGGSDDYFWVAPQEGTWTPASAIIEVNNGEFYGLPTKQGKGGTIAPPLCFIPRGFDNSTGGMIEITSDKWGPFKGSHVGLSYGSGIHYLIHRDESGDRPQGATVPLEGEFLSGSMRGAFHPNDGQLYLVGLDGWGDYSTQDGCFHRVRYLNKQVNKPSGFQTYSNGIKISFPNPIDQKTAEEADRYFAHAWNYEYAKRYGSPEFSAKDPKSLGHDPIEIRSVSVLEDGKSIFVEMPKMEPVMQLHIRMHLKTQDGTDFKTDLFASPMFPGDHFAGTDLQKPITSKPSAIALRVVLPKSNINVKTETGTPLEGAKSIQVDAIGGLQYAQTLIEVEADAPLAWKLRNTDVMPHNLVLVQPGAAKKIGEASFKMLSDPKAGEKNYVPELPEVIAVIPVIDPEKEHTLHFRAPKEPGDYPYICTFPGHWMAMQGILRVK